MGMIALWGREWGGTGVGINGAALVGWRMRKCDEARKVALGVGVSREGVVPRKRTRRWIYI
jgi:hypothetical protein